MRDWRWGRVACLRADWEYMGGRRFEQGNGVHQYITLTSLSFIASGRFCAWFPTFEHHILESEAWGLRGIEVFWASTHHWNTTSLKRCFTLSVIILFDDYFLALLLNPFLAHCFFPEINFLFPLRSFRCMFALHHVLGMSQDYHCKRFGTILL